MPDTFTPEQISQILEEFFRVVGTRQYIGARYVPIFGRKGEESIEWDNTGEYEPLTIVLYQGNSYTSRQFVPVGVEITNQDFWAITGNYNAQVELYRRETAAAREVADNALAAANNAQDDIDTLLPKADFSAENTVKKYVDDSVSALQDDIDTALHVRPICFDTVADMIASTLNENDYCITSGYHAEKDGGGALYHVEQGTPNGFDVLAIEGSTLVAKLVADVCNVRQFGAWGDDTHDDSSVFNHCVSNYDAVFVPQGIYYLAEQVNVTDGVHIFGAFATLHGTDASVLHVQTYESTQDHTTPPVSIEKIIFRGNNGNTLVKLEKALKVTISECYFYEFSIGVHQLSGYELTVQNLRLVGARSDCVGLRLDSGDCTVRDIKARDVHTLIYIGDVGGNYLIDDVHGWILEPTYFKNSCMIENHAKGGNLVIINNPYFDTYHNPYMKCGLSYDTINNPIVIVLASVASDSDVSNGFFAYYDDSGIASGDRKYLHGKLLVTNYMSQAINTGFYTLTNSNYRIGITYGNISSDDLNNKFISFQKLGLVQQQTDVEFQSINYMFTDTELILNMFINVPADHVASQNLFTAERIYFPNFAERAYSVNPNAANTDFVTVSAQGDNIRVTNSTGKQIITYLTFVCPYINAR